MGAVGTESSHPLRLMAGYGNFPVSIMPSGNVGIGTTAPTNPLTVIATNNVDSPPIPKVIAAGDPSAPTKTISIGYNTTADAGVLASVHAGTGWKNTLINPVGGNVGIGTAVPSALLDVNGGNIRNSALASVGNRCVYADLNGVLRIKPDDCGLAGALGDNLGNHIATQNILLGSYWLSGDGGSEGGRRL